jgi:hypothetical protein
MNLAAVTITVYFYGLVNFSGTGNTREVVAPLVPAAVTTGTTTLMPHGADIVIRGFKGTCPLPLLIGDACTVTSVTGTVVKLPAAKPDPLELTDAFKELPALKTLCTGITGIKPEYLTDPGKYAVRLTLDSGTLDACAYGAAWGSSLVLNVEVPSGTDSVPVVIGATTVQLKNGAVMYIRNRPTVASAASGLEHFGWFYVMAKDSGTCDGLPTVAPPAIKCPPAFGTTHSGSHPAATGLGCSNSTYP